MVRRLHGRTRTSLRSGWRSFWEDKHRQWRALEAVRHDLSLPELIWFFFRNVMAPTPSHSRTHSRAASMTTHIDMTSAQPITITTATQTPLNGSSAHGNSLLSSLVLAVTWPYRACAKTACARLVRRVTDTPLFDALARIIRSGIPYLIFLTLYGSNSRLGVLPRYQDIDCVRIYNVSAMEYAVLRFSPHKLISSHHNIVLDFLSTVPYLLHYILPVAYPLFIFWRHRSTDDIQRFYWLLGFQLWIQYCIWYFFPTAPPWFYDNQQRYASMDAARVPALALQHKEGCAFRRVDHVIGVRFFFNLFGGNPVPFGAFPSGHVAWPLTILAIRAPGGRLFVAYVFWMAWATMYTCHHYLSDVIGAVVLVLGAKKFLYAIKDRTMTTLGSEPEYTLLPSDRSSDYSCRLRHTLMSLHKLLTSAAKSQKDLIVV